MKLIIGLGNPGASYARNRHNIGFMVLDALHHSLSASPWRSKFQGQLAEASLGSDKILLLKPETFMNLSGQSVGEAMRFYKLEASDCLVFYDELDLPPGKLRIKQGGGHNGHNGIKSLDSHIGQDYWRIRLGIGHPGRKEMVTHYVLHDFAKEDESWLGGLIEAVTRNFPLLAEDKTSLFMTRVQEAMQQAIQEAKPAKAKTGAAEAAPLLTAPKTSTSFVQTAPKSENALTDKLKQLFKLT